MLDLILCPICKSTDHLEVSTKGLHCQSCGKNFKKKGEILDFIEGKKDTQLNVASYDADHLLNFGINSVIYKDFKSVVSPFCKKNNGNSIVEIGSGSGAWTTGLYEDQAFSEILATDISFSFLQLLAKRMKADNSKVNYLCVDAHELRIAEESIDLVVGRSILHHIYDYKFILSKVSGWLKPDGTALFYEPIFEGKIWVAFFFELIKRIDTALSINHLSKDEISKLNLAIRHIMKDFTQKDIEKLRPNMEDKYIFRKSEMDALCKECGFSHCTLRFPKGKERMNLAATVKHHAILALGNNERLHKFEMLFEAFEATFGKGLAEVAVPPMGYFVFHKS